MLVRAFPLDRGRTDTETLAYVSKGKAGNSHLTHEPPFDAFMRHRQVICRFMREAFEEEATWLVEMLEKERESISAAQAAYALALEKVAWLR